MSNKTDQQIIAECIEANLVQSALNEGWETKHRHKHPTGHVDSLEKNVVAGTGTDEYYHMHFAPGDTTPASVKLLGRDRDRATKAYAGIVADNKKKFLAGR